MERERSSAGLVKTYQQTSPDFRNGTRVAELCNLLPKIAKNSCGLMAYLRMVKFKPVRDSERLKLARLKLQLSTMTQHSDIIHN